MNKEIFIEKAKHNLRRTGATAKWIILPLLIGCPLGCIGAAFYYCISYATDLRTAHPAFLLLLPVGAIGILFLYHLFHIEEDQGTNLVLSAIYSDDEVPLKMTFLIFISTVFSHLCGASVGREGAALQIGGSVGNFVGKALRMSEADKRILITCGMSGVFSALFGTPAAAAIFALEVVNVGIMNYSMLVPCVLASFVARGIAMLLGVPKLSFTIIGMPELSLITGLQIGLLAVLCGLVSIAFCMALRQGERWGKRLFKNKYLRALVCGGAVLAITFAVGDQTYNGTGVNLIQQAMDGTTPTPAFLIKIVITTLCIVAGYKGGEIIPSFFIGATFGCLYGSMMGISPSLCAAVGLGAVFCGATNCPITSFLICFELFGFEGCPYFMIAIALSYMVSGYYGLYSSQKIVYSKYRTNYINKKTL